MRRSMTRRMPASVLAFGLTGLVGVASASAQGFGFRSLGAAERAAARIMDASGLVADFEIVVAPGTNNAYATIRSGYRIIIYDPEFLRDIERRTDEWGPISIMAHEVAHHLQGHSVHGGGSNPPDELDADFFSGFVLQKLGASLDSAQAAMRLIASPRGGPTHPPRRERLEYIARGWRKAAADGGAGGGSASEALAEMQAELRRMGERLQDSEARVDAAEERARTAQEQARTAQEQARTAQANRSAAEEELRDLRARGDAAEAEVRAAEARVRQATDQVRAAEARIQEAQEERDAAAEALALAEAENERFGEQAQAAEETADRALLLTGALVPLVLAALVLSLRKPRQKVVQAVDRATDLIRGRRRNSDSSIDPPPSPDPPPRPSPVPQPHHPIPPPRPWFAPAFDGSGLERCGEPGGFVLGRDGTLVDAVVDHRSVSRRHVRLTRLDGRLRVEDLNSTNGTRVNGRRLEPFAPCVLATGDAVVLGDVHLPLAV